MTTTQLHLMLNHVPVLGTVFVVLALSAGLLFRSSALLRFGLAALLGVALAAIPVFFTGEPAEEALERIAGVAKSAIELHESVAKPATFALGGLGLLALIGLAGAWRRTPSRRFAGVVLVLTLGLSGVMAWTAHLGGVIRHTEIQTASASPAPAAQSEENREHD